MGDLIVWYIFISAIIGLPRSLISIPVFGVLYILNGGASGSNSDALGWFSLLVVAGINTGGIVVNIRRIKSLLAKKIYKIDQ
ncbi:MAG: hypothetical protein U1F12_04215 [Pseudomonadales bacterium]|nr:hypothetical protein [Pseudomonadales bacterium]